MSSSTGSAYRFKAGKQSAKKKRSNTKPVAPKVTTLTTSRTKKWEAPPQAEVWENRTPVDLEVPIGELFIPGVQRETQPNAKGITEHFEPFAVSRLKVNVRKPLEGLDPVENPRAWAWEASQPTSAKYAVTDGYQRLTAMRALGFTRVKVEAVKASVEYENWFFRFQKMLEAPMKRGHIHNANLCTDKPETVLLDTILQKNGFYTKNKLYAKRPTDIVLSNVTGVEDLLKSDPTGEGILLDRVLRIIRNCWSSYPVTQIGNVDILRGVGLLVKGYGSRITPEVEALWKAKVAPLALIQEAKGAGSQIDRARKVATKLRVAAGIEKKHSTPTHKWDY
jgi:hypothetical protein